MKILCTLKPRSYRLWSINWHPNCHELLVTGEGLGVDLLEFDGSQLTKKVCYLFILVTHQYTFGSEAHSRTIRSSSWAPDGAALALACFDSTTSVWTRDGEQWSEVSRIEGHENEVKSCAWSPDGQLLATCSRDKSVWINEKPPGGFDDEFGCKSVLSGHTQDVKCVRWSRDGSQLYSCGYDDTIRIWEFVDEEDDWVLEQTLNGHTHTVWCIDVHPVHQYLASCSQDGDIRIFTRKPKEDNTKSSSKKNADHFSDKDFRQHLTLRTKTGAPLWCLNPLFHRINNFQKSEAHQQPSDHCPSEAIEYDAWKLHANLTGHYDPSVALYSIAWSPCGKYLAVAANDNTVRIFKPRDEENFADWVCVEKYEGTCDANCVAWRPFKESNEDFEIDVENVHENILAAVFDDGQVVILQPKLE